MSSFVVAVAAAEFVVAAAGADDALGAAGDAAVADVVSVGVAVHEALVVAVDVQTESATRCHGCMFPPQVCEEVKCGSSYLSKNTNEHHAVQ